MEKTMRNIVFALIFVVITGFVPGAVRAQEVAGISAHLGKPVASNEANTPLELAIKKRAIKNVLTRYGSPMTVSVDAFIKACTTYSLDCYLLPSIAGLESTLGKFVAAGTYNPYGWGRGYIPFKSWDEATLTVAKGLRENYFNKGAQGVYGIAPIYSESPTWAPRVEWFMGQFEAEEAKTKLLLKQNGVEL